MKKALIILLLFSFIFTSCASVIPSPEQKISVISAMDFSYSDSENSGSIKFSYNKDGNLSEILSTSSYFDGSDRETESWKTSFEYDENGFLQKSFTYRNDEMAFWYDYKCNSEGKIIEARKYDFDAFRCYIEYFYNSDGTLAKANIYNGYSDLFFTSEYSYNDAGNIILEDATWIYSSSSGWKCHNFSYSYSPNSDSKLMSFNISYADPESNKDFGTDFALEYDSSGNLCKHTLTSIEPDSSFTQTCTYQHTVISATDKTTFFLSDGNQYCDPFFGIYCIEGLANANF